MQKKGADQLCSSCAADQCLCISYRDRTVHLHPKSEISSLWPSSVAVQPGLCDLVGNPEDRFSRDTAQITVELCITQRIVLDWLQIKFSFYTGKNVEILQIGLIAKPRNRNFILLS